ncbi:MAG: hypothetical protein OEW60_01165, partial [Thiovulaceae bacterium]|nr:hypothetical protein [Sulfurimonadaceae bacterium]
LFAKPMMLFFTPDVAVVEAGVLYVQISAFALLGYILIFLYLALLQGIKRPVLLFYISLMRQFVAPGLLFILFSFLSLPLIAYWWGITAIVWVSALFVMWYAYRKLLHVKRVQALDVS